MDDHSRRSSAEGQMGRCTRRPGSCQIFLISPALCFQASLCFAIAFKLLPYLPKGIVPMFTDVAINQCPYLHITNNISFSTFSLQNCWNFPAPSQFTRKMENLSYTFSAKIFLNWKKNSPGRRKGWGDWNCGVYSSGAPSYTNTFNIRVTL